MLICFSGFKGSGKDSCANYLIQHHNAVRVAFADPLKDMVSAEYDVNRQHLDDPDFKEQPILDLPVEVKDGFTKILAEFMFKEFRTSKGKVPIGFEYYEDKYYGVIEGTNEPIATRVYHTPRSLAILKGSTNRLVRSDFWVHKACDKINKYLAKGKLVALTDLRYKSEMEHLRDSFGKDVLFVRVNRFTKSQSNDPSENDLNDTVFDYTIDNTGTLEDTYKQLEEVLK
jgi:hypothetical protein